MEILERKVMGYIIPEVRLLLLLSLLYLRCKYIMPFRYVFFFLLKKIGNYFLQLTGVAVFGLGIYSLINDSLPNEFAVTAAGIRCLIVGMGAVMLSILGCSAAYKENINWLKLVSIVYFMYWRNFNWFCWRSIWEYL